MTCPVLNLFSKCCCSSSGLCSYCLQLTIAVVVIVFGALIAWKPKKVIDIQTAIYRPFNWKLEPINMEKEIKNTRIMGIVVLILGIVGLVYIVIK